LQANGLHRKPQFVAFHPLPEGLSFLTAVKDTAAVLVSESSYVANPMAAKEASMLVKEIMTPKMESVLPRATLREAAQKMRNLKVGSLPVMEDGKLIGMITDRDICCRGVAAGFDPVRAEVREIMSREISFCFSDDAVTDAVRQMEDHRIRRLAVLNRDKTVAGILSVDDLAHYSRQLAGEVLDSFRPAHH
jgi:CBS domain-containing protein